MAYWAVVSTHPQAEQKAMLHLEQQGFTCYAPRYKETRVSRGRKYDTVKFLFPRYLFVWVADQWRSIMGTFGVAAPVMTGLQPARLPTGWIENMKRSEHRGVVVLQSRRTRGERVRVNSGKFQGYQGVYAGMTSRDREVVLLDMLGRVELAAGDLD